jgi:hypothetical protein
MAVHCSGAKTASLWPWWNGSKILEIKVKQGKTLRLKISITATLITVKNLSLLELAALGVEMLMSF